MTQESYKHPIAPPPELVQQWRTEPEYASANQLLTMVSMTQNRLMELCQKSAQHGADQELEACCEWLEDVICDDPQDTAKELRDVRRPKPPSLKEQALKELAWVGKHLDMPLHNRCNAIHTIHRALEQLSDNE